MKLFHVTNDNNVQNIALQGVLPELAVSGKKRSWWVDRESVLWALAHISARDRISVSRLIVIEAHIPSNFYTRWATPGLYYVRIKIQAEVIWGYEAFVTPEAPERHKEANPRLPI